MVLFGKVSNYPRDWSVFFTIWVSPVFQELVTTMELFAKMINGEKLLTTFAKCSILDV